MFSNNAPRILIVGIGNVLMGDEGVGVYVIRHLEKQTLPSDVACLDGGTGGFHLLEPMQQPERLVMVDATADGAPAGTVQRLQPRYSTDYPPTLCAHDIGLKDLLDSMYLLGTPPNVTLFAVSIDVPDGVGTELSPAVAGVVPEVAKQVMAEVKVGSRS